MRSAPAPEPERDGPAPPPTTGLPEAVLAPAGRVPRHEISATTRPSESHPSEQRFATVPRLSTCPEPARSAACIPAPRCSQPYNPRAAQQRARRISCQVAIASRVSVSGGRLGDVHLLPFLKRVGRVDDDLIADVDTAQNFQRGAEVAPNVDGVHMHLAVLVDDRNPRSLGAEQHGVYRNRDPRDRSPGRKMHLAE